MASFELSARSVTVICLGLMTGLVLLWILLFLIKLFRSWRLNCYLARTFPHPKAHWFFGHLKEKPGLSDPSMEWWKNASAEFPRGFLVLLGPFNHFVVLNHPEHIAKTLIDMTGTKKSNLMRLFDDWLGNTLAIDDGASWWRRRKLLTKSFHSTVLRGYTHMFNQTVEVLLRKLSMYADRQEPMPAKKDLSLCTLDAILRAAGSFESRCQEDENSKVAQAMGTLTATFLKRLNNPLLRNDFIFRLTKSYRDWISSVRYMHSIQGSMLQQKKSKRVANRGQSDMETTDFLDTLLMARDDNGACLTEKEIKDDINGFIFAGNDTSSSALAGFLLALCKFPEHQVKVQQEIDAMLDGRDSNNILWEDLPKLTYLTMCLKESLRMYDSLSPFREVTQPITIDDKILPPGTIIYFKKDAINHNPAIWGDNHNVFDPNRFSKEQSLKIKPYQFVPFSAGPRNCIGQNFAMAEIKVFTARILREYNLELAEEFPQVVNGVTTHLNEMRLRITRRTRRVESGLQGCTI